MIWINIQANYGGSNGETNYAKVINSLNVKETTTNQVLNFFLKKEKEKELYPLNL